MNFKGWQIATRIDAETVVPLDVIKDSIKEAYYDYGANVVRYQMIAPDPRWLGPIDAALDFRQWSFETYSHWWWSEIANIKACCEMIRKEKMDIQILVDCHSAFKGVVADADGRNSVQQILLDDSYRQKFEYLWLKTVEDLFYDNSLRQIAGYGLCNEPAGSQLSWIRLAKKLTKKIRQQEKKLRAPRRWIFISTTSGVVHRLARLRLLKGAKVAVEVHLYCSGESKKLMRRCVKKKLRYVRQYSRRTGKPILIGEMGASRYNSGPDEIAEFWGTILPALERIPATKRGGGGGIIHALNEGAQWDVRATPSIDIIKEWMR